MNFKNSVLLLLVILILGMFLRFYNLGKHSFWFDEATSIVESEDILNTLKHPFITTNLLFVSILHFLVLLSKNEFFLRLLPLFLGILSIIMAYKLGQIFFSKKVGLISAFLLSISPFHIYYSQELRGYTLVTFLSSMSIYYLNKSFVKNNFLSWIYFVIFITLSIYTHSIVLLLLVAVNFSFFLFYKKYKNLLSRWLISQFIILLLCIPYIIKLIMGEQIIKQPLVVFFWVPKPSLLTFIHTFNIFNLGYNATKPLYFLSFLIFLPLFLYGIWNEKKGKKKISLLLSWLFIPIIMAAMISIVSKAGSIYLYRFFLFILPAYIIIVANGLNKIKNYIAYPALLCILSLSLISLYNYYRDIFPLPVNPYRPGVFVKKDNKLAAEYIRYNLKKGDGIAHTCRSTYGSFVFYNKNKHKLEESWVIFGYSKDWSHWSKIYYNIPIPRRLFNLEAINIQQFIKNKKRIWLVLAGWDMDSVESPEIKEWLDNNYILVDSRKFKGLEIYLYDLIHCKDYPPDKRNLR